VPPRPWWTTREAALLVALYHRTEARPARADLERLREQLLELAAPEYRDDPSYRSVDSIRSQLSWVHLLAERHPRAREAPRAFQDAWARYRAGAPLVEEAEVLEKGAASDRRELIRILQRLRATLAELVESPEYLPEGLRRSYAVAWAELEERGHIEQAIVGLRGPAVDDLLAVHGLVGPQRVAKSTSVREAVRERQRRRGWGPLKALLNYLNSILGSLTAVFPWLNTVKEFKEITEASAELASQTIPEKGASP
jgi:hypothetical protein